MTKDEALKLALEAIQSDLGTYNIPPTSKMLEAITAIKQAFEAPAQEPVQEEELELFEYWNAVEGWVKIEEVRKHFGTVGCGTIYKTAGENRVPVYTAPQQRPWVGLTDEEIVSINDQHYNIAFRDFDADVAIARDIEAKLKEKNT